MSLKTISLVREDYDKISGQYESFGQLPQAQIEWELCEHALRGCEGQIVLDLGGGTGHHARQAIDLGATHVDNIDISPGMLEDGKSIGANLGRKDPITWLTSDISKPLDHLPLKQSYDVVLVGWTFDHAESNAQLEAMWENASRYARPGGKLINIRMANPHSRAGQSGKYGVQFTDFQYIPGGLSYKYAAATKPVFICPATTMKASMEFEQAKTLAERYGFVDYKQVPAENLRIVKDEPDFWALYLGDPFFMIVTATKKP